MTIRPLALILASFAIASAEDEPAPLKALLVTGGCCHDYGFQAEALTTAIGAAAEVEWTVVNEGGKGTKGMIGLYDKEDWAKGYDVVVHNECFADTSDEDYIRRIVAGHRGGTPAVVIHCAMHTYRSAKIDDWRQFLGVTSRRHDHQSEYPVTVVVKDHPAMKVIPEGWVAPKDELYIIEKVWPTATPLATSKSEKDGKTYPVIWTNDFGGTRVFGTTFGHTNEVFGDEVFLGYLTRGLLWAAGRE